MDVFDLLFDLIGLLFALIGKFWTILLVILGYTFFGKQIKQAKQTKKPRTPQRPVLTPVFTPSTARREVRPTQIYEPVSPPVENADNPYSPAEEEAQVPDEGKSTPQPMFQITFKEQAQRDHQPQQVHPSETPTVDPREAMKWALIFSPPRAKQPYSSTRRF